MILIVGSVCIKYYISNLLIFLNFIKSVMGCGTSISENEVNKPSEVSYKSEQDIKTENPALKKIQSEKVVPNGKHKENMNESQKIS